MRWYLWLLLSPLLLLLVYLLYTLALYCAVWLLWCARGKDVLLVYSDSPIWKDHIRNVLLPRVEHRAVVLNWSERARWNWLHLAPLTFQHFGGSYEFNPLAVVFRPFRRARVFRFWAPYKDFKHGKPQRVERMETELLRLLNSQGGY